MWSESAQQLNRLGLVVAAGATRRSHFVPDDDSVLRRSAIEPYDFVFSYLEIRLALAQ
jgi:hypothetical protein